jgi:hypothetical protein
MNIHNLLLPLFQLGVFNLFFFFLLNGYHPLGTYIRNAIEFYSLGLPDWLEKTVKYVLSCAFCFGFWSTLLLYFTSGFAFSIWLIPAAALLNLFAVGVLEKLNRM